MSRRFASRLVPAMLMGLLAGTFSSTPALAVASLDNKCSVQALSNEGLTNGGVIATSVSAGITTCYLGFTSASANRLTWPSLTTVNYLVVGGGGGGGSSTDRTGGGGGAGGIRQSTLSSITTISGITVGNGGAGSSNGQPSIIIANGVTVTANGGGAGAYKNDLETYIAGAGGSTVGSGGGGMHAEDAGPGISTSTQGHNGGIGFNGGTDGPYLAGGGGGYGANGADASEIIAGAGGAGTATYSNVLSKVSLGQNIDSTFYIAGGGGGGGQWRREEPGNAALGGVGGGGTGGTGITDFVLNINAPTSGAANTGGGGGGGVNDEGGGILVGASGGSGLIVFWWTLTPPELPQLPPPPPMTPETAPSMIFSSTQITCTPGKYSQKSESVVYTLLVGDTAVSTHFSNAMLPVWLVPWAGKIIDYGNATTSDASWDLQTAWKGKSVSCITLAYANHATGSTSVNAVVPTQ